jgi:hypothetical protein
MTMHLIRGANSLNTRKPKRKLTKARLEELQVEWRAHNKLMKRTGNHDLRYNDFNEYLDYCHGKVKFKKEFKEYEPDTTYRRTTPSYPSASISPTGANASQLGSATGRPKRQEYTGTLVKGIATMHKSNAVPIINSEQATEISRMAK